MRSLKDRSVDVFKVNLYEYQVHTPFDVAHSDLHRLLVEQKLSAPVSQRDAYRTATRVSRLAQRSVR